MATLELEAAPPRIVGAGTLESAWRRSAWLAALPTVQATAWLGNATRLLVVSPHPDDEVLGCGGLIATARATGIEVRIVSVTDGEACYPETPAWPAAHLRAVRRGELEAALACLDVAPDSIETLDLGDGCVSAQEDALTEALVALLQPGDRVMTTWRDDGHPDHEATARAAERAAPVSGAHVVQFPVWAWHWMPAESAASPLPGAFRCALTPEAGRAKARALACFTSQTTHLDPKMPPPILPPHVLERFGRAFEVLL